MENKITLEITAKGWIKTAIINGVETKDVWELTSSGARGGSYEDYESMPDELYHVFDNLEGYSGARFLEELSCSR